MMIDEAVRDAYVAFDLVSPDDIVTDPAVAARFCDEVNRRLSLGEPLDVKTIGKRLITLRKRGEAKGGLPRRWRQYNGRNSDNGDS